MTALFPIQGRARPGGGRVRGQRNADHSKAEMTRFRCVTQQYALRGEPSRLSSIIFERGPAMPGGILCEVAR